MVLIIHKTGYIWDMSTDTTKENASIVDSSVTQKHEAGNLEEPESSSYRVKEDGGPSKAEDEGCRENLTDTSNVVVKDDLSNSRYFIIKSLNHQNIQLSVEKGIWATQVMNEPILEDAFHSCRKVILIFSVNSSGFFQGYAQMISSVGRRRDNVWSQGAGASNPWGRSFRVKWLQLSNLPFHKTLHLKNPLNDYKPVKISRDCQELPPEIGEALCELIDAEAGGDVNFERGLGEESGCSFPDEGYNISPTDMTWATAPMLYPSFLYQYHAEASGSLLANHKPAAVFPPESLPLMASKGALIKHLNDKGLTTDSPVQMSSKVDSWQLSRDMSPLCSTISEDEFLEMSYEEYLEAHSRGNKQLCQPSAGQSWRKEDSSSKEQDEDLHSHGDHVGPHKKPRH